MPICLRPGRWVDLDSGSEGADGRPQTGDAGGADPDRPGTDRGDLGRYRVVVDGTIDNRAELAQDLGLEREPAGITGLERLIAAAYERWGSDFPKRLLGEFAFILWDCAERQLLAVRDVFGLRELFHRRCGDQIQVASQLQMLVESPSPGDLDEEYVADFLVTQTSRGAMTPFKTVRRLESSHMLTVREGRLGTRQYWDPSQRPLIRHRDAEEAAEHFLAVFRVAVDRSLATGGRAWAHLSGGLDSSSIVCVAHEILRSAPGRLPDFGTISLVWEKTRQSDERRWLNCVVEEYGLKNIQIPCDDRFFDGASEAARYRNDPHFGLLFHPMGRAEVEHLRAAGVDTILSGSRAESVILAEQTPPVHLADYLRQFRFGTFWRELLRWQAGTKKPLANLALTFGFMPLLKRNYYPRSTADIGRLDPWLGKDFARRMDLRERARSRLTVKHSDSFAEGLQLERLARSEQMIPAGMRSGPASTVIHFFTGPRGVGPGDSLGAEGVPHGGQAPSAPSPSRVAAGGDPHPARWPRAWTVRLQSLCQTVGYHRADRAEFPSWFPWGISTEKNLPGLLSWYVSGLRRSLGLL